MIDLAKYRRSDGPLLVVVSGPSGVGKDAVFRYLKTLTKNWYFVITVTTRAPREDETNGVDYVFVDTEEFSSLKQSGKLLEFAPVYGNWYGTPREPIEIALSKGMDVLMKFVFGILLLLIQLLTTIMITLINYHFNQDIQKTEEE